MAKRTILQCFFKAAGELLEEELEARQKARQKAKKPPPESEGASEPESQAKPEEPKTEPPPGAQATSEEPSTEAGAERSTSTEPGDRAAAPPETGKAPEGAPAEAPAANTTRAQPPMSGATWATDLGASVHDPPRSDTWDFSGAADAGASIDGGDEPADDAQAVQAAAHRGGAASPASDATQRGRRRWRGHVRRRRAASPSSEPTTPEQTAPPVEAELQRLRATVEELRSEVSTIRVQQRAGAVESDHIPAARPPGGTTPGVVPRHVAPRPDPTESGALERPAPGDAPGSRRHAAKATEPAFGQGVGATAETTSTQDEELPPPPEWYLNTPIVGREAWEIDEDAEPELIDDEIDYTQIEEYDPRDDPDMERVA